MQFVRTRVGAVVTVLALSLAMALGAVAFEVHLRTRPPRVVAAPVDFESMMLQVEEVEFPATDDVLLSGWLIRGNPALAPIVLCHDFGSDRHAVLNTALSLSHAGFTVLAFDFRGHGASGGDRSTLGLREKRDVLGAVDYLLATGPNDERRIGVFGAGMGAYAAVLAAADRPSIKVLVLDGLYPDVGFPLSRAIFHDWNFAVDHLGFLPRGWFLLLHGAAVGEERAADVIPALVGRDMLLLAPAGDTRLADAMMGMYESVPEQADADGNLVVVPVAHGDGLYADQLARYHDRVTGFFLSRLDG
ncbi:MAG TPA: alpha/beta fold hydrolase [Candidatus Polarisedimenticolaceae bacterium]|nr:alpha/beta fold hydrolase [Candidatus Polarisedimenticolaceae bacterium]